MTSTGLTHAAARLDRRLVAVMAVATGLAVANNYYAQPLLPTISHAFGISTGLAGVVVTVSQAGYSLGLLALLPLGDMVERRALVSFLSLATALALWAVAAAPSAAWLLPAAFAVGTVSVLAQVLVPFAAGLAGPQERGQVVGMVMSGLLVGVLLARTVAGWLAEAAGWRAVYLIAGGLMIIQAGALRWQLPRSKEKNELPYLRLVTSVAGLLRDEPLLRLRSAYGLLAFGSFSVLWTSVAFLLARHYHYSTGVIGLFGLVGAAGAVAASLAGRSADQGRAWRNTGVTSALLLLSWGALWAGKSELAALVVGLVALDLAVQGLHITNQSEIYRLHPGARSRLTAAYMFTYFVGGAVGSVLSAGLYQRAGWDGTCAVGGAFAGGALLLWLTRSVAERR